jgi:hypothetical protein
VIINKSNFIFAFAISFGFLLNSELVHAQPKPGYLPTSTHIFPAGGRRGTTVKVRVGTECAPPGTRFSIFGKGVKAPSLLGEKLNDDGELSPRRPPTEIPITYPIQWASEITIAADAPIGPVFWRLSCAQGGTASRPFVIGDLPEYLETESNSTFETAEQITLPVTVNGRIHGERDSDYFRFSAEPGTVVVCDVLAGRLGSRLDPVVEILDSAGRKINAELMHIGSDPVLAFRADSQNDYVLRISNVTVHGDPAHVYRINITTKPFVRFAFPAGGQAGTDREIQFYAMSGTDSPHVTTRKVSFPPLKSGSPTQPGFQDDANSFLLDVTGHTNVVEQEPNDLVSSAMKLNLPVTVDGRMLTKIDEDWFEFSADKGERYSIVCRAVPAGTITLPALLLTDANGKQLKSVLSAESVNRECRLDWTAPQTGVYRLRVRDLQYGIRGGAEFIYRLTLRRATPDFSLRIASDGLNITQGKICKVAITVNRIGGFEEPIDLSIEGLPEGITVEKNQIPAKANTFTLTLNSDLEKTVSADSVLSITGTANIDGKKVGRIVKAGHLEIDSEGIAVGTDCVEQLHLTVQHKPSFRLFCSEAYLYAHRGSVFMYPMEIERLDGFDGEITLQIGDRQNRDLDGIEMFEVTFPPGQSETFLPIYLPETMHINVQSQSQLYSQAFTTFRDTQGKAQSVLVLSEKRNMLRTLPPVVKLQAVDKKLSGNPGDEIACRLQVERTTNFPGGMELKLLDPSATSGFVLETMKIAPGQTEIVVKVRVDREQQSQDPITLRFRATGRMPDGTLVITETKILFRFK